MSIEGNTMPPKYRKRPDLLLLLSLLLIILTGPELDHGKIRQLLLAALMFVPVVLASVRLSEIKGWVWPSILLALGSLVFSIASGISRTPALQATKWVFLAAFFAVSVVGLFSHLRNPSAVTEEHLYTAVNIYLLLGMTWFALYSTFDTLRPGSILHAKGNGGDSELLYFSLVTLATIGYGDVVPVHPEVRILAALEGITGVLYIAITVALLVSSFRRQNNYR